MPRARRLRAAVGGDDAVALLVQRMISAPIRVERFRRFDPETGALDFSGWLRSFDHSASPGSPIDAETPPPEAALRAAELAEIALGQPLETEIAVDGDQAWLISARPLRASARARVGVAVGMANSGLISKRRALMALDPSSLEEMLHPSIAPDVARDRIASGLSASPGAATGRLCFSAEEAAALARAGEPALLTRAETTPEDVHGMDAAVGVLTTRGGLTSHAAVVARGMGRPCVVGASDARIDAEEARLIASDGRVFRAGDWVTLDGSAGELLAGQLATREAEPTGDFATLMRWADGARRLRVRANADTPGEAETAIRLGVDGVGLCRTEHMFFDPSRITVMREMILADDEDARRASLARLLPMQRADFAQLFEIMGAGAETAMEARPVTIRLLDPPLHEFLPADDRGLAALAQAMNQPVEKVSKRARDLREFNPMLGKRGCRLGVAFPEIYEMQARAIFEAALNVEATTGRRQRPEIMIPLVSAVRELALLRSRIDAVAAAISEERGAVLEYGVGIMIETPRAALRAAPLAEESAFFSFGTNDLTQMTYGLSRDDATRLMRDYVERGVFEADPFQSLDEEGVGELIRIAVERGRAERPELAIGLCGEHGGSPATIDFCERVGMDYVSCSPYRAPIARLAAAQAAIRCSGDPAE